jgi:hypothetical protein
MMSRREQAVTTITEALGIIEHTCRLRGLAGLFDLNRSIQHFFCEFLSEAYELSLIELDNIQSNFPAIDLGDEEGRRCFQVTSDKSTAKVQRTLAKYVEKRLFQQYGRITVLVLGDRQRTYKALRVPDAIEFNPEKDIIGIRELVNYVRTLRTPTLEQLATIIGAELHAGN